ncbi:MAG: lipocalin-like domain-containing protein [Acidobacteria bacterium]|nr:lipocalin-like domain-containing protein [Acidobacteriota bacterium]
MRFVLWMLMGMAMTEAADVRRQLIGVWELVSYETKTPDGKVLLPIGEAPVGRITYDKEGRMSAQLMRRGVAKFASNNTQQATPAEIAGIWDTYRGYFGRYTVDEKKKAVIHHVDGAWFPNYVGSDQVRYYRFEADRLILEADLPTGRSTIVWRRAK